MVNAGSIKGVIFDLDGTLYHLRAIKLRLTLILWRSIGILRNLATARKAVRFKTFKDREDLLKTFYAALAKASNISTSSARDWYQNQFQREFLSLLSRKAFGRPGICELVLKLKQHNVKLAVVSDLPQVSERLEAIGVSPELFDDLVATEEFGVLKPLPKPMEAVAEKWGLSPEDVLVVGDRGDLDGESAAAAKMNFIGIDDGLFFKKKAGFYSWKKASIEIEARTGIRSYK